MASNDAIDQGVRDWYKVAFPSDEMGDHIREALTFEDASKAVSLGRFFYDVLGVEDSVVRERVFSEIAYRSNVSYDEVYNAWIGKSSIERTSPKEERPDFKDRLVVLDTRPGWDGQTDALLYDPDAPKDLTPFIIAQGYDEEYKSWQAGSYRRDLLGAVCEFRGAINPKWAISGCTPDDVVELYGDYCRFGPGDAEDVAHTVNEWISNYDDLFTDEIGVCVEERLSEGKLAKLENTPEAFAACVELHGAKLVSPEDIMALVASYEEGKGSDNLGVFAAVEPSGLFTVCDNETGECFVESFETVAAAYSYMTGADPQEARGEDRTAAVTLREHAATPDPVSVARDALDAARAAKAPATPTRNASVHQ